MNTMPPLDEQAIEAEKMEGQIDIKINESDFILRGEVRRDLICEETLVDIFRSTARNHGRKTALKVLGEDKSYTYAQLDDLSDKVAKSLVALGVEPGMFVGLWFKRSIDLHIAMIGILKAGAAYVPFDADLPSERVVTSLADCDTQFLVSHADMHSSTQELPFEALDLAQLLSNDEEAALPLVTFDMPAYAIYTSGSTGKPKGIIISHKNVCNFLRSVNSVLEFGENDNVFQGASVAFDLSIEEIWVPYLVGATLKVATINTLKETDTLPALLNSENITVIDTVPTLLAMIEDDVPSLRTIVLGGESCPASLVARWAKKNRKIWNTYGPTETTVTATYSLMVAGAQVSIGVPLPNYSAYVVDEEMKPTPKGGVGELLIGGCGVSAGYIRLPQLTCEKFIENPFDAAPSHDPILYRSGDAVSISEQGTLLFHGRIDDQVKVRGFRIELGDIENQIIAEPGVQAVAVAVHDDGVGGDVLVAHIVPDSMGGMDMAAMRIKIATQLPPYMIPSVWRTIEDLPKLISGKVDRKALSRINILDEMPDEEQEPARSETEAVLLEAARSIFPGRNLSLEADFFTGLGGHSLLAAKFVSAVRKTPQYQTFALQDTYRLRTLRKMAEFLATFEGQKTYKAEEPFTPPALYKRFLCGLVQACLLPIILSLSTLQWLGVFLSYMLIDADAKLSTVVAVLCLVYVGLKFSTLGLVILLKWVVMGRTKEGTYPLWGTYYLRWWFITRLIALVQPSYFANTPIFGLYLRALGAKVGKDVNISHSEFGTADLMTIGDGVSIGHKAVMANAEVVGATITFNKITLGEGVYVGNQAIVHGGTTIGANTRIEDMAALSENITIGANEIWEGSPAEKTGLVDESKLLPYATTSDFWRKAQIPVYATLILFISAFGVLPVVPAFLIFEKLEHALPSFASDGNIYYFFLIMMSWGLGFALVFFTLALVVAFRWIVMPERAKEGLYSVHSGFYVRKWLVNLVTEVSLDTLSSLYATIYMRVWYRMMGARIGKGAEISTNLGGRYDLTVIGSNSFIADECSLGDEDIHRGWMYLRETVVGHRVFIGNNAVIGAGANLADDSLIGVKSLAPPNLKTQSGETWFGIPAIQFPNRQKFDDVENVWTYEPALWRKVWRAIFEALHTTFPTALFITFGSITVEYLNPLIEKKLYGDAISTFVLASVLMSVAMMFVIVFIKWAMMGVYKPVNKPLWSWWAMRTEAVAVLYWGLGGKVLLEHLRGTPFLPWCLRLFGTKVGKGVWLDTTDITEFDCVKIGDFSVMNSLSCLQTHLYEDRLMKVGRVELAQGVSIGAFTTVLYDTKVGEWTQLGSLSLIMKGEEVPSHSKWVGAPAQPCA